MGNLGVAFAKGKGVPVDARAAVAWFRKAAELGDADAMYNLSFVFAEGKGVPVDARAEAFGVVRPRSLETGRRCTVWA
jgi:TPR repeat protein